MDRSLPNLSAPSATLLAITGVLILIQVARSFAWKRWRFGSYLGMTCVFFVAFSIADLVSFRAANWIIAIISFLALREYFSMVDIRLQDRLGILGAYISIPFQFHFVTIQWYGMFIIAVPVYTFLAIALLVALGGKETDGTVFSIGAIAFGLFLFVYSLGHISYLMSYSVWMAATLILNVAVCDGVTNWLPDQGWPVWARLLTRYLLPLPATVLLTLSLSPWTTIPVLESAILAALIPALVMMGRRTGNFVETDLGVAEDTLGPGRGQVFDSLKSLLFVAPVVFHFIRYYRDLP